MNTETLVRASADVIRITTLTAGDVYKRLEKEYNDTWKAVYGIVQTVDFNGEDAMITGLEFEVSYAGISPKLKIFGTSADLKLFATTPEEVRLHIDEVVAAAKAAVVAAKDALDVKRRQLDLVSKATTNQALSQLKRPAVTGVIDVELPDE